MAMLKRVLNMQNRQDRGKKNVNKNLQKNKEYKKGCKNLGNLKKCGKEVAKEIPRSGREGIRGYLTQTPFFS